MKPVKTTVWDSAEYLQSDEDITIYLNDIFSTNDTKLIIAAIGDVTRARGMSKVAEDIGCGRESLYKSLSQNGNPSFDTIIKVMSALGYRLIPSHV